MPKLYDEQAQRPIQRIKTLMTVQEIVIVMSDRNPGAMRVVCELLKFGPKIDPDAGAIAEILYILDMDREGIWGHRIWQLYKDVCKEDLVMMASVLRAQQFGMISSEQLTTAINNYGDGLDLDVIMKGVIQKLPAFGKAYQALTEQERGAL